MSAPSLGLGPGPEGFFSTKRKAWCPFCGFVTDRLHAVWPGEPRVEEYVFCKACIREFHKLDAFPSHTHRSVLRRAIQALGGKR